jgi:nucleosome assembly protein 1-like 1
MSVVNEDDEDDIIDILNVDFEIGQALRERIIPRAILYFTGEALEDDTDFATETEDEDGDEVTTIIQIISCS